MSSLDIEFEDVDYLYPPGWNVGIVVPDGWTIASDAGCMVESDYARLRGWEEKDCDGELDTKFSTTVSGQILFLGDDVRPTESDWGESELADHMMLYNEVVVCTGITAPMNDFTCAFVIPVFFDFDLDPIFFFAMFIPPP